MEYTIEKKYFSGNSTIYHIKHNSTIYIQKCLEYNDKTMIDNELKISNKMSSLGIGPHVIDIIDQCIIMEKLDITVDDLLMKYKNINVRYLILNKIISLISSMHSFGFYHGDISFSNIMVKIYNEINSSNEIEKYSNSNYRFYLIDFEYSGEIDNTVSNNITTNKDWDYLAQSFYDLYLDFQEDSLLRMRDIIIKKIN